jgi:hypothetical protein
MALAAEIFVKGHKLIRLMVEGSGFLLKVHPLLAARNCQHWSSAKSRKFTRVAQINVSTLKNRRRARSYEGWFVVQKLKTCYEATYIGRDRQHWSADCQPGD